MAVKWRRRGRDYASLLCVFMLSSRGIRGFPRSAKFAVPAKSAEFTRSTTSSLSRSDCDTSLAMGRWTQNSDLEGSDRIKACVPYILPLLDGDQFGKYIYSRFSFLGDVNDFVMGPLVNLNHKIPFFGVGLFVLLTLGTRFNTDINRNVRFSAQQAALIDVALIIPELIRSGFIDNPLPRYIAEPCSNFVWYSYMSAVIYCIYSNLTGKKPDQIPIISSSAELMVGPF